MIVLFFAFLLGNFCLSFFFPMTLGNLSIWTPSFFLCYLVLCRYKIEDDRKFYQYIILFSFGYGILYSHYFLLEVVLGFLLAVLLTWLKRYLEMNSISLLLYFILSLLFYETISYACYSFFHLVSFSWYSLWYKISHTILFNCILLELCYVLLEKILGKKKRRMIN